MVLERFREAARGKFAKIILALIAIPFALWGVESYIRRPAALDGVATVGSERITQNDFSQALRVQQDQYRQILGANFDAKMFDDPAVRTSVLDNLVNQRVLLTTSQQSGLRWGDAALAARIMSEPAFQENGQFSRQRFEAVARANGLTLAGLEARLREDFAVRALSDGVAATSIASRNVAETLYRASEQSRDVSIINFVPDQYASQVKLDPAEVKKYYDDRQGEFATPEQVKVEYIELSVDTLAQKTEIKPEEIKQYYDGNSAKYVQKEERRASHILIGVKKDASQVDKDKAKAKADALFAQVKTKPDAFADVAKKESEDPGSAANGGDLDFFGRGMMVKSFEDAVFGANKGDTVGPVLSDFGYHIIRVTDVRPERRKPLEEASAEIALELKRQKAQAQFAEKAEKFTNIVYEQPASLKPAADATALEIQTAGPFARGAAPVPSLNHPKLAQAIFAKDAIEAKRNTEAIDVGQSQLIAARVVEHKPATPRAFADVQAEIDARLKRERAAELARKAGQDTLKLVEEKKEAAPLQWPPVLAVSRTQTGALPPPVIEAAMKVDQRALPAFVGVDRPGGGFTLVKITKVNEPAPLTEDKRKQYEARIKQSVGMGDLQALVGAQREALDVRVRQDAVGKKDL